MTPEIDADYALLERWRAGESSAGEALVVRYFGAVRRFFRNKVGNDVEDLVQQTFLGCVEGRDGIRQDGSFRTYLYSIARFQLYSYYRKRHRDRALDFTTTSVHDLRTSPTGVLDRQERQQQLMEALQRMPIDLQLALELSYWEELTAPEIAVILNIPENTVYSRVRRAREQLRSLLSTNS